MSQVSCDPVLYSLVLRTESVWNKNLQTCPYSSKASSASNGCSLTVKVEIHFIICILNWSIFQKYLKHERVFNLYQASYTNLLLIFSLFLSLKYHRDHQAKIPTNNPPGIWNEQILIQQSCLIKTAKMQLNYTCFLLFQERGGHIYQIFKL